MLSASRRRSIGPLTASAAKINIGDPTDVIRYNVTQHWQREAWDCYSAMPELHYPANFIGSTLSRFILRVGELDPDNPTDPPNPDPKTRSPQFELATEALAELNNGAGGHKELLRRWGINSTVAADCWLLGTDGPVDTTYEMLSILEIMIEPTGKVFRNSWGTGDPGEQLTGGYGLWRFWKAHPARTRLADSAMQSLLDDCRRLMALNDSITSRLLSRLSQAGILAIPNSLSIPGAVAVPDGTNRGPLDPFVYNLLQIFEKGITNRKTAAGVIPVIMRGPDDAVDKIKHITLDRFIDETEMKLRAELRQTIAQGLDLPPEAQTGMGDSTHWQAWSVQDSSMRSHLIPLVEQLTEGLTRKYLWPYLTELSVSPADISRLVIYPDGTQVVTRPNEAEDQRQLHDRIAVSDAALRRGSGVSEDDAPGDEEQVRQVGRKINNAFLALWGLPVHDQIPWELVALGSQRPGNLSALVGQPGSGGGPQAGEPIKGGTAPVGNAPGKPGVGSVPPSRRPVDNGTSTKGAPGANAGAPGVSAGGKLTVGDLRALAQRLSQVPDDTEIDTESLALLGGDLTFLDEN